MDDRPDNNDAAARAGKAKNVKAKQPAARIVETPLLGWVVVWALLVGPAFAQSADLPGWDGVWEDQFNGSTVDFSRCNVVF